MLNFVMQKVKLGVGVEGAGVVGVREGRVNKGNSLIVIVHPKHLFHVRLFIYNMPCLDHVVC
jgi:hypothetical protein